MYDDVYGDMEYDTYGHIDAIFVVCVVVVASILGYQLFHHSWFSDTARAAPIIAVDHRPPLAHAATEQMKP